MKNFLLITAWGAKRQAGTHIPVHVHDYYEVVYYVQGAGNSLIQDTRHQIAPHSFVVIPPGVEHEEYHTANAELFCIGFQSPENLARQMLPDVTGEIGRLGKAIIREITEQHLHYAQMAVLKLQELVLEVLRLERVDLPRHAASVAGK